MDFGVSMDLVLENKCIEVLRQEGRKPLKQ